MALKSVPAPRGSKMINKASGFTLIEVLVAVVILAIGLLGLAGLQTATLRNNQSAYTRSQATQLAYDIADRIRANPLGNYNNQAATNNDCVANTCTPTQMAGYDLAQWNSHLASLPSGTGIVCLDNTPLDGTSGTPACDGTGTTFAVKIWWADDIGDINQDGVTTQRFVMSFQP
jgi:type IV pilus assembly protein PilV